MQRFRRRRQHHDSRECSNLTDTELLLGRKHHRIEGAKKLARPSLSVCIVTQNMAHFLPHVLASVSDIANEIVVVDSFSEDGSVSLLESHPKVRLWQRRFNGHFGDQKNFAIEKASSDWILVIDSDEILGDRMRQRIPGLIASNKYTHYKFARYWIVGEQPWQFLKSDAHYPDFQLRLFRNTPFFRYRTDKVVHTHFPREGRGPGKKMKRCHIFHFDFVLKDREARQEKYRRYIALDPDSESTSRMYLFEETPHELKTCREPLSVGNPSAETLSELAAASRHSPRKPAAKVRTAR